MNKTLRMMALLVLSALPYVMLQAEVPAGYYSNLKGKSESALKTALYNIIHNQSQQQTYNGLPSFFRRTDVRPGTNYWWDMYSDMTVSTSIQFGTYMNREHSLPKSWWGGGTNTPAYTDINHLYPGEAQANQAKSNYPLGEIKAGVTPKFTNGVSQVGVGVNSGGAAYVFEPANEYKGDFARTYFYMVTCYQDMSWTNTWQVKNGVYPSLQQWAIDLLLKWHRADPVSQKEQNRNEQVYLIQANRNPFIDYPDLVEYIWGDKKGQPYNPSESPEPAGDAVLVTPPNKMALDFNQVATGYTAQSLLQFRGENMNHPLTLSVSGVNRSFFKVSASSVGASAANAESGTWVTVTYSPTSVGNHTARLIITMDERDFPDEMSRVVELQGECLEVPELTQLTATPASDITSEGFRANWDETTDEVIDYYVLTLTTYAGANVTTEEIPAENNYLEITDLPEGTDYVTYSVQSERLGIRSPMSNVITVTPSGIGEVTADGDRPLVVESYQGMLRFRCSEPQTDVVIYDVTGRVVMMMEVVNDGDELTLPMGIYFVTSASHRSPVKTIAR